MGLLREGINEMIATTQGNAAPMGFIFRNESASMVLFKGSHTEENIRRDGWVVANVTHDPVVWVRTAFEDLSADAFIDIEAEGRTMQRLAACEAWAAFHATVRHETAETYFVTLEPLGGEVLDPSVHPHNRGFAGIVEATVHATRFMMGRDPALRALIDHHLAIVQKCGGPREREAAALLEGYII
ncbi:DUF447 domain-containing protein [Methanofollis fontis]|uniref:DUF447 domain-containing protein n=1 Tax=Methanofollis fontis TaxID=2052832 RepID=A0A483CXT6_9EURY|nr:DUF447 domain-containing protein [Methanofollis fontis]TAJ44799.1 DUF447 domain-containing protein [Methanofollis fontis]